MCDNRTLIIQPYGHHKEGHPNFDTYNILNALCLANVNWTIDVLSLRGFQSGLESHFPFRFFQVETIRKPWPERVMLSIYKMRFSAYDMNVNADYLDCLRYAVEMQKKYNYRRIITIDGFNGSAILLGSKYYKQLAQMGTKLYIKIINVLPFLEQFRPGKSLIARLVRLNQRRIFEKIVSLPNTSLFFFSKAIMNQYLIKGLPVEKALYCPFGASEHNFIDSYSASSHKFSPGKVRLLFFGLLRKDKGIEVLLNAIKLTKPGAFFIIAGSNRTKEDLNLLRYNDTEYGAFIEVNEGYISENKKEQYYNNTDFILIPFGKSHIESSGVFFDAVAYRRPIIASEVGDMADYIKQYNLGYLCKPEDPQSLAEAIEKSQHCTQEEYVSMQKGFESFFEKYAWDKVIRDYWIPVMM